MTAHYSTVGLDEKRAAVDRVVRLVSLPKSVDASVDEAQKGKSQLAMQC